MTEVSLTNKTVYGASWRLLSVVCKLCIQLVVMVVLARMLSLSAFGQYALAQIVIAFATVLAESAMSHSLIQQYGLSRNDIRVAWTLSVICGGVLSVAIVVFAHPFAALVGDVSVANVIRLIGVTCLFDCVGATASALLQREFRFRALAIIDVSSYLIGYGFVSVTLAISGFGVWSIAWGLVSQAALRMVMLLVGRQHPKRPYLTWHQSRRMLTFNAGIAIGRIANCGANNVDNFIVGRWLGEAPLGVYSRAYQLMTLPVFQISNSISTGVAPAFSKKQHDSRGLATAFSCSIEVVCILIIPILALTAVLAPEAVVGFFGDRWQGAVRPLQIFCLAGPFRAVTSIADALLRSKGRVYVIAACHMLFAVNVLVGALIGLPWGIAGVSVGVVAATIGHYVIVSALAVRTSETPPSGYLKAHFPGLALGSVMIVSSATSAVILRELNTPPLVLCFISSILSTCCVILWLLRCPLGISAEVESGLIHPLQRRLARVSSLFASSN